MFNLIKKNTEREALMNAMKLLSLLSDEVVQQRQEISKLRAWRESFDEKAPENEEPKREVRIRSLRSTSLLMFKIIHHYGNINIDTLISKMVHTHSSIPDRKKGGVSLTKSGARKCIERYMDSEFISCFHNDGIKYVFLTDPGRDKLCKDFEKKPQIVKDFYFHNI